jgi:predicted metal-binding membrane protein
MIIAYPDRAQPTRGTGEREAPPCVLVAGFALAASMRQYELNRATGLDPAIGSVGALWSGAVFLGNGVCEFSILQSACGTLCSRSSGSFLTD